MFIKRTLYTKLFEHLPHKEISLIIGPRQVGKTTLMKKLQKDCQQLGKKTLYLNLDIERDATYFVSQEQLLQKISLECGTGGVIFIDEIQKKENAGVFLKGLYDMELPYKFVISGSGSLELKEKIHESLVGRKRVFELGPVSFLEFIHYRTEYRYEHNFLQWCATEKEKLLIFLEEYMNYGGYPQVVLAPTQDEKVACIDEIYKSYILKDITRLLRLEKPEQYVLLLKLLATQVGQLIKYTELSKQTGLSEETVKKYLYYAMQTYIITLSQPFHTNLHKEILKSPMVYYVDHGMRNYLLGFFGTISSGPVGYVFQNFIYNMLYQKNIGTNTVIKFWRTIDGGEVDIILQNGSHIQGYEVKYVHLKKQEIGKSLHNFLSKYATSSCCIVNLSYESVKSIDNHQIVFLPFWKLLV